MKDDFNYSKAKEISVEMDGKNISGRYDLNRDRILSVDSIYGRKSTQLGSRIPESLARTLLQELYYESNVRDILI